jgi:hypothetical protein
MNGCRPYNDPDLVHLRVDGDTPPFIVHLAILRQSEALAAQRGRVHNFGTAPALTVYLDGIDEATAHVLVHYLYTQRYEALEPVPGAVSSYEQSCALATRVYFAGLRYRLPGLVELAKGQIFLRGARLGVEELLSAVRECAFPLLPEGIEDDWFEVYLEDRVRDAARRDAELVTSAGFVASFEGNSRLLQIVWRTVMAAFKPCAPAGEGTAGREEMQGSGDEAAHDRVDDGDYMSLTPVLSAPDSVPAADDALRLDTIEPTESLTTSSEHGSYELGSHQLDEPVGIESPASSLHTLEDVGTTPHAQSDAVVQVGDATVVSDGLVRDDLEKAGEVVPEPEVVSKKMSKKEKKMKELRERKKKKLALLPMGV